MGEERGVEGEGLLGKHREQCFLWMGGDKKTSGLLGGAGRMFIVWGREGELSLLLA